MKTFTILTEAIESEIKDLKAEIREMIKNSLNTSDNKTVEDFILAYKKDSEVNQIEGLINNSDIYDFYLKNMDEIDEVLKNNNFFTKSPEEQSIYSLYDYIIAGTKAAVEVTINNFGEESEEIMEEPKF